MKSTSCQDLPAWDLHLGELTKQGTYTMGDLHSRGFIMQGTYTMGDYTTGNLHNGGLRTYTAWKLTQLGTYAVGNLCNWELTYTAGNLYNRELMK